MADSDFVEIIDTDEKVGVLRGRQRGLEVLADSGLEEC
jgi:hypothetical protein